MTKYTRVIPKDEKDFDAHHLYNVVNNNGATLQTIKFQKGPIKENGVNGVTNEDLLEMVIDRIKSFQESKFKCRENAIVVTKLEEALLWLNKRTFDRERRNVEGTHIV